MDVVRQEHRHAVNAHDLTVDDFEEVHAAARVRVAHVNVMFLAVAGRVLQVTRRVVFGSVNSFVPRARSTKLCTVMGISDS